MIARIRAHFWPALAACAVLTLAILSLMPAEKTIGQVIRIVYLHGALSRAGMAGFVAAGIAGVVFLLTRRPAAARWCQSLLLSAWVFWCLHFLVSMPATRLTWGPWIAWGEPRVTMTLQVVGAGGIIILLTRWLREDRLTAAAAALLGLAMALLAGRSGVIRHPLDPIGSSPSSLLQFFYLLLLLPIFAAMILVAGRWAAPERK